MVIVYRFCIITMAIMLFPTLFVLLSCAESATQVMAASRTSVLTHRFRQLVHNPFIDDVAKEGNEEES